MRVEQGFQQTPLKLPLPYSSDHALHSLLERTLPHSIHGKVDDELRQFEKRIAGRECASSRLTLEVEADPTTPDAAIRELAAIADTLPSSVEPSVTQFDQWGQRVDKLHTSTSWQRLKGIAAEEGLVGIAFERDEAEFSRTRVFAKVRRAFLTFLFDAADAVTSCRATSSRRTASVRRRPLSPRLPIS